MIGVIAIHDIDNTQTIKAVQDLLKKEQEHLKKLIKLDDISEHPHIMPWRHAYKKFGVKPKKYPPSIENLTKRILKGGSLSHINTLVDLYNIVSLRYLLPAGGKDLEESAGDIQLTFAKDNEKSVVLLGEKEARQPQPGEVIYKDNNGAICRRWNWKEAERTKLTEKTKHAFLVFEVLPPVGREILEVAVNQLATYIEQYCGGTATVAFLDANNQEIVLKKNDTYVLLNKKQPVDASVVPLTKASSMQEGSEEHRIRVEKVHTLRKQRQEPWPQFKPINATCKDVVDEFVDDKESRKYHIAGRLLTLREHGKTIFANIQDRSGQIQIYIRKDIVGDDAFDYCKHFIDIGDIIWCSGLSFCTKMGEITLKIKNFELLSKCLHPLPEKWHGIHDVEIKYRQRYLDLIATPESRERFQKRSEIIRQMRSFLDAHQYMEVETPMLHPIPGGATARPFVTHHNALDMDLYLRIAPELYLKRLVVGGFERVYEINRSFRNEGISTKHNPEFTMVEFYTAHQNYMYAMDLVEKMIRHIAKEICESLQVSYGKHILDFAAPFRRIRMQDIVAEYAECTSKDLEGKNIDAIAAKQNITFEKNDASWGEKLNMLFEALVEGNLIQPTFITQFPTIISPLAKRNPKNPQFVDRFELFIAGVELSNGFNELNDPFDQAERFREQAQARAAGKKEAHYYDADYVQALEYGLPPTVGVGIGIDRLTMFLTNAMSIRDVILFPTLKRK